MTIQDELDFSELNLGIFAYPPEKVYFSLPVGSGTVLIAEQFHSYQ